MSHDRRVLLVEEVRPIASLQHEVASRLQLRWRHSVKHNDIQAGSTVVGEDLNRHHLAHWSERGDPPVVVLRQVAGGRTELVRLKHDQRPLACCRSRSSSIPSWTAPTKQNTNKATAEPLTVKTVRERCRQSVFNV